MFTFTPNIHSNSPNCNCVQFIWLYHSIFIEKLGDMGLSKLIDKVSIHIDQSIYIIDPQKVVYCELIDQLVHIHSESNIEITIPTTLIEIEHKIPTMWRSHPNFLVNLNFIEKVSQETEENTVTLKNQIVLPIDPECKCLLLKELSNNIHHLK